MVDFSRCGSPRAPDASGNAAELFLSRNHHDVPEKVTGLCRSAPGRKRTLVSAVFGVFERPLSGKADIQILIIQITVANLFFLT